MAGSKELETIVREILEARPRSRRSLTVEMAEAQVAAIAERDYDSSIGAHFTARELGELLAGFSSKVPDLNRAQLRGTSAEHLHRTAADLGARLELLPFEGMDADGLRGFYARRNEILKRSVIWVNSAQHEVATAASFWHEVGHHLDAEIGGRAPEPVVWSLGSDYAEHLDESGEIVADIMVCLAAYPKPIAETLFADALQAGPESVTDAILLRVRPHMRERAGLDFRDERPTRQTLQYLAGMLHFGKIRLALLRSFGL